MMKWLAGLFALSALGLYGLYNCVFCYDKPGAPVAAGGKDGRSGRPEIVLRLPSWPMQSLDPAIWKPELVLIQGTISEGLFGYDRDLNVIPKVAKGFDVTPDKLLWTIHLRTDKRWSNGDKVTAHDYLYGWTRFISPSTPSETWASVFPHIEKAMDYKAGAVPLDSVGYKALNDSTIRIRLSRPKALPSFLAMGSAAPLHKGAYEAAKAAGEGDFWCMPGRFVGNGPYLPESFVRDGEVELVRNPRYVGPRGNVDRFILKAMNMASQNVQLQQYEAGELDLAQVLTLGDYAYATKARHLKDQVSKTPEIGFLGVQVAHTVNQLMDDPHLRKAIALALDREDIATNVMGGRVVPTHVFGPPGDPLWQGLTYLTRDVEAAKAELKKSSYKGEPIYLFTPPATDVQGLAMVSEVIQSQLKAIGLNVVIENMEQDLLTGTLASYIWGGGYLDDARYTRPGLTLFPGKVLWKEPVMLGRGMDHVWYWMNFPYELKALRKRLTLEKIAIKNEEKGWLPEHWDEIVPLRDSAQAWYSRIRAEEKDTVYRDKVAEGDPAVEFDRLRSEALAQGLAKAEAVTKWQNTKDRMLEAHFNFLSVLRNGPNLEGNRLLANIEAMTFEDASVTALQRRLAQISMDQHWIMPLVSENLVYVKKPFLSGETLYKFGVWNMVFNLHYIEVDEKAYFGGSTASRGEAGESADGAKTARSAETAGAGI